MSFVAARAEMQRAYSAREKAAKFHLIVISEIRVALIWPACDEVSGSLV